MYIITFHMFACVAHVYQLLMLIVHLNVNVLENGEVMIAQVYHLA